MRKLLFVLALLGCAQLVSGQSYSYLSYSNSEGLPQSQVTSITQDQYGYLWVGTLSGLASFNGRKFTSFSTENGLVNNRVTALKIVDEKLWIGHEGGFSCMVNGKAKGWQFYTEDRNIIVSQIVEFKGTIVIATNGGGLYFLSPDGRLRRYRFHEGDANRCRDLVVSGGKLLIATRNGIFESWDLKKFVHNGILGQKSVSGFSLEKNRIVISTYSEGLFSTDLQLKRRDSIPLSDPNFNIKKCFTDQWGQTWLSSVYGVMRISRKGAQLVLDQHNGLPTSSVNCVFEDREGNIWFGTEGKGLLRFTGEQFAYFNKTNGFPSDLILSMARSKEGVYYYGSYDQGIFKWFSPEVFQQVKMPASTGWTMEFDAYGNLWCGTNLGITMIRPSGETRSQVINGEESRITIIRRIHGNTLIAGGPDGIGWIRNETFQPIDLGKGENIGTARDFVSFNQDLICASDKGLFVIDARAGKASLLRRFRTGTTSLSADVNNRLWIGTENGLYIYDGVSYSQVFTGNTSGSRFINFVERIGEQMYIGTNNGLYVFNAEDEKPLQLRHYGVHDGLINLESNINSAFYDGKYLWFGTAEGLIRFSVQSDEHSRRLFSAPLININGILLNYEVFDFDKYSTSLNKNGFPRDLRLPYNKNNISIDLDGILLADPNSLKYQFWLEGMDDTWSPLLSNSSIVLSNLPSGKYKLHIRTMNQAGIFSEEILLPVTITPPFWGTWWFYLIIILLMVIAINSFYQSRIKKERDRNYKENLENKTRLLALEQQSLNASMNRHFIFNSLNSIQYFINTQDRLSANRYLTSFAKLIRKNLDSAAEGDNIVTLQQEMERLELYLSLEAMRFKDKFDYEIDTEDIDTESIVVPAMLLQPFVENSIIHGILPDETKKGLIRVQLRKNGKHIEILLSDNGVGIDYSLGRKKTFDEGDHKSQGMEITSKRIDLIRKMWKQDYELYGPYQVQNSDGSIKGTHVLIKIPYENLDN